MCVYPRCGEMTSPNVEKKSHSDTMFWCRWRAIINKTWTHKLSSKGVCLFTTKGAKPTKPASLSWGRFVPVFYGAIYIITSTLYILVQILLIFTSHTYIYIYIYMYVCVCVCVCVCVFRLVIIKCMVMAAYEKNNIFLNWKITVKLYRKLSFLLKLNEHDRKDFSVISRIIIGDGS